MHGTDNVKAKMNLASVTSPVELATKQNQPRHKHYDLTTIMNETVLFYERSLRKLLHPHSIVRLKQLYNNMPPFSLLCVRLHYLFQRSSRLFPRIFMCPLISFRESFFSCPFPHIITFDLSPSLSVFFLCCTSVAAF